MMEPIINIQEVASSFETRIENEVLHAVRKIGVDVDKERLIRALEDARSFYDEGYAAGVKVAERRGGWISVEDRLPEVETRVLVSISRHNLFVNKDYHLTTCAIYEDGTVNVEDSCWMCETGDYDEEADVCRVPKGWYEYHEYGNTEEDGIGLIGGDLGLIEKVTHWMPLPEAPKEENHETD